MSANLTEIFRQLREQQNSSRCAVCAVANGMDAETKEAFGEVMRSTVTIKAIVSALSEEGISLSRYQLGEVRRECINGNRDCQTFKGAEK